MKQQINAPVAVGAIAITIVLIIGVVFFLNREPGVQGGTSTAKAAPKGGLSRNDPMSNMERAKAQGIRFPDNAGR